MARFKLGGALKGNTSAGNRLKIADPIITASPSSSPPPATSFSTTTGALTDLPPEKIDDLASQAIVDALNPLSLGAGGVLTRDLRQLGDELKQLAAGSRAGKPVDGFRTDPAESFFTAAVSKDDASLEGATYKQGQMVYANRPDSKVKAVYRVQVFVNIGMSVPLPVFPVSFPLGQFDIMIPVGFLYQLDDDKGFIYQMPLVPKIEAGIELDVAKLAGEAVAGPVGGVLGLLSPFVPHVEVKAETTIEQTFVWIHSTDKMAFRALAVLMMVFNISPIQPFTIGLQSCEGNDPDADLPVPFPADSQSSSTSDAVSPTIPISPLR